MTFIKGQLQQYRYNINWAGSLLPEILMILFTQSTDVLHKILNDELKILCLLITIFPRGCTEFPENSLIFLRSEKSLSVPGFPGLWPPWLCGNGLSLFGSLLVKS